MKKLTFFILLGVLVACSAIEGEKPQLEQDKFVDVMIDLYANEGIFSGTYNLDSTSASLLVARNEETLKKHGVTKKQFLQTYRYYNDHKQDLEKVFQTAIDSIQVRRDRLRDGGKKKPAKINLN